MEKFLEFLQDHGMGVWVGLSILFLLLGIVIDVPRMVVAGSISLIISGITIMDGWGAVGKFFADALKGEYSLELAVVLWGMMLFVPGVALLVLDIDYDLDSYEVIVGAFTGKPLETALTGVGLAISTVGAVSAFVYKRILS